MLSRLIGTFVGLFLAVLIFGIPTHAAETERSLTAEDFMWTFGLDETDLEFRTEGYDLDFVSDSHYIQAASMVQVNGIGGFVMTSGLDYQKFSTFACERNFIGHGSEGAVLGLMVYTYEDGRALATDSSVAKLGASGLYSDRVCFVENSKQYLLVALKENGIVSSRVFEVTTKEAATKALLENLQIQFMKEVEEEPVRPVFELPQTSEIDF